MSALFLVILVLGAFLMSLPYQREEKESELHIYQRSEFTHLHPVR